MSRYVDLYQLVPETHAYEGSELSLKDVMAIVKENVRQVGQFARDNTDQFSKKSKDFATDHFTSVSSRVLNEHLSVSITTLADALMNPELLVKMFPSIMAYVSSVYTGGGKHLGFDVDYIHEVWPLLRSGEKRVIRCMKKLTSTKIVIAEFSMRMKTSPPAECIKLPSGFVIEEASRGRGGCTVSIVDNWLIKKGSTSPFPPSSAHNGAHRLWTALQRYYLTGYSPERDYGKFRPKHYKEKVLDLSTRMVNIFCSGIAGVRGIDGKTEQVRWVNDEASNESVHIFKKAVFMRSDWKWKSLVLSASVDATPSALSSLLHARSDIWKPLQPYEIGERQVRLWRGHVPPTDSVENNCVSVHQIKRPGMSDGFLIEETYSEDPKAIVRTVLDGPTFERVVKRDGDDPNNVTLLPFGFVILPASDGGGSTVSVGYQFDTEEFNVNVVKTMVSDTLTNITNALSSSRA